MTSEVKHDPREAVLERLAARYDHFAEMEQRLVGEGRYAEAQGAHEYARWVLRAFDAEFGKERADG